MVCAPSRYLVFFQYLGTRYSGVVETSSDQATVGVQNYLEKAAEKLKPLVPIKFHISSRTDAGVHALCNAAHLDIQRAPGKPAFSEEQLVHGLNHHLKPEPISYLDVPAMRDAAQLLLGTHDFSTFRSHNSETPFQSPIRTILQIDIQPSSGFLSHHYEHRGLQFWELKFRSRSFLYRQVLFSSAFSSHFASESQSVAITGTGEQFSIVASLCSAAELVSELCDSLREVRRMVGTLVAVGQGKLRPQHIKELLEMRDARALPSNAMAPATGLFLKSVEYNEADLNTPIAPGE